MLSRLEGTGLMGRADPAVPLKTAVQGPCPRGQVPQWTWGPHGPWAAASCRSSVSSPHCLPAPPPPPASSPESVTFPEEHLARHGWYSVLPQGPLEGVWVPPPPPLREGARPAHRQGRGQSPGSSPRSTLLSGEGWAGSDPDLPCPHDATLAWRALGEESLAPGGRAEERRAVSGRGGRCGPGRSPGPRDRSRGAGETGRPLGRPAPAPRPSGRGARVDGGGGARFGRASDHPAAEGPLCAALDSVPGGGRDIPGLLCGSKRAPVTPPPSSWPYCLAL